LNDKFTKFILLGILLCLIIITIKPINNQTTLSNPVPNPNISFSNYEEEFIQLAPNRLAIKGNPGSGLLSGTILVFDYDTNTKKFNFTGSMNYSDYFRNTSKYGIPTNNTPAN